MGGWVGGWLDTDNKTISVQLNLTGTATGTELGNLKEKKGLLAPRKNKLGLSLRTKKGFLGQKVGGKIENKGQKLTNFQKKEKKDFSSQKNKLKRRKKDFFASKIGEKN